jgi:hypothetical protein
MATVTANGIGVLEGTKITRPLVGVWIADLVLDDPSGTGFAPGTQVTIASEGGYSIVGVVDPNRTGDYLDATHCRVIGGAGGMGKAATARAYVQPGAFARDVVNGLVQDSGETLSATADAGFLGTNLAAWMVMAKPCSWNLRALLKIVAPAMNWRILSDGTLWIGSETWPAASATFDTLSASPSDGSYELGVEAPFVAPGMSISGLGNINRCVDVIEGGKLRTHVYVDLPSEGDRGIQASIVRMVAQAVAGVDYFASYVCQVESQSADLTTVDINPVGARNKKLIGGLSRVPVRFGTGIKIQIAPGATVLLGWDGGDPSQPYVCCGLSGDSAQAIQLGGIDPLITKQDLTALINAISSATYILATGPGVTGGTATPLVFSPPGTYGSTLVGAGR